VVVVSIAFPPARPLRGLLRRRFGWGGRSGRRRRKRSGLRSRGGRRSRVLRWSGLGGTRLRLGRRLRRGRFGRRGLWRSRLRRRRRGRFRRRRRGGRGRRRFGDGHARPRRRRCRGARSDRLRAWRRGASRSTPRRGARRGSAFGRPPGLDRAAGSGGPDGRIRAPCRPRGRAGAGAWNGDDRVGRAGRRSGDDVGQIVGLERRVPEEPRRGSGGDEQEQGGITPAAHEASIAGGSDGALDREHDLVLAARFRPVERDVGAA